MPDHVLSQTCPDVPKTVAPKSYQRSHDFIRDSHPGSNLCPYCGRRWPTSISILDSSPVPFRDVETASTSSTIQSIDLTASDRSTPSQTIFTGSGDGPGRTLAASRPSAVYRDAKLTQSRIARGMRASSSQLSEAVAKQNQNKSRRKISMRLTVFLARPDPWEILDEDEERQWSLARELLKVALRPFVDEELSLPVHFWFDSIFFPQFKNKPALSSVLQFDKRLVQNAHIKEGIAELSDLDWERQTVSELFGEDCPFRFSKTEGRYLLFLVFYEPLPPRPQVPAPRHIKTPRSAVKPCKKEKGIKKELVKTEVKVQPALLIGSEFNSPSLSPSLSPVLPPSRASAEDQIEVITSDVDETRAGQKRARDSISSALSVEAEDKGLSAGPVFTAHGPAAGTRGVDTRRPSSRHPRKQTRK
ncbi:hypothetical protein ACJZ2D_014645 [Fusarium nematophilum]